MTLTEAYEAISSDLGGVTSGPYGIEWGPFRISRGSGIAGGAYGFWITVPGNSHFRPAGPFKTKHTLRRGLRNLIVQYLKLATVIGDAYEKSESILRELNKEDRS